MIKFFPILMGLFAGLLFGLATPFSKLLLSHMNSFQLAGLLYLGAGVTFLPHIFKNFKSELSALKQSKQWKYILYIIVAGGILGPLFLMLGLNTAHSMSVSIWLNLELVATAILGLIIFKDQLDKYALLGVVITLVSGILVSLQESSSGILSGIFVFIACIFWGVDNHLTAIVDGVSPKTVTFIKGLVGGLTNLTIGLIISGGSLILKYIPIAILIGIFSYGISIVLYVSSAQNLGATRSQILFSSAPFWGVFAAFIILGESFNYIVIISFVLLVLGIIFTTLSNHYHMHHHSILVHQHFHRHDDNHHNHQHSGLDNGADVAHSHLHTHNEMYHIHNHYPDLHHRHDHNIKS